ncbi:MULTISPECIES: type II CAAX endopeptidase family protein [Microbacterium]|uniref:CPBP family intramembrane glutamic endopeptidase n=1 Tax=Microbacterium TaxID=33882 RepID=UPI000D653F8C|nr:MULTISPECIES: type II CAAX endopeptidase family protein [Microbacterium]
MTTAPPADPRTPAVATPPTRVAWRDVIAFILLACGLAWLVTVPLWLGEGLASPLTGLLLPVMMFTPAVATLIVMFAFRAPATGRLRHVGMWPLRPVGRFLLFMALGLVLPIVVVIATVLLAGAVGLVRLDLVEFSAFADQLAAAAPAGTPLPPIGLLVAIQLAMIPVAAIINSALAFGEELGWRGWLQTALLPLGPWPALLITGAVWGLWHAPIILLGYNFARPDITGVLFMVGGCLAWGVLLGWLRLRSASLWPAVLAHGSLNAVGGLVLLLAASGAAPDLAIVGALGVVAWGVLAVVVVAIVLLRQFRAGMPAPARVAVAAPFSGGGVR